MYFLCIKYVTMNLHMLHKMSCSTRNYVPIKKRLFLFQLKQLKTMQDVLNIINGKFSNIYANEQEETSQTMISNIKDKTSHVPYRISHVLHHTCYMYQGLLSPVHSYFSIYFFTNILHNVKYQYMMVLLCSKACMHPQYV